MTASAPDADSNLQVSDSLINPSSPQTSGAFEPQGDQDTQQTESDRAEIQALRAELHQTRLAYQAAIEMAQFQAGFLARTSHELRSPINSVIGLHQLILADLCDSPEEEREFVAQAYGAAQKMLGLMDELIQISQLVQKTASLNLEPVPLGEILADVEQATRLQAKNRGLQLEIQLPDPAIRVLADERRLRQVLLNLVDMPLRVMQQGFVRLTLEIRQETVQIEIVDQRPAECWQESIDLLPMLRGTAEAINQASERQNILDLLKRSPVPPSIGLQLLSQRAILELMGGQLTLIETPVQFEQAAAETEGITRLCCTLPLFVA
ncbi:sensor histidine kinase [Leptolyngbya ohadii]|uniref:sensor histidine kinase n=1 Tax=Leptolyngbya ohadii TaxID=1962290 RepID=UPI000B59E09D|nr:HAMP domain-containing sensor histidine kinase [Leptolyngbya ohadii]